MGNLEKTNYVVPTMLVLRIELEQGIAAGSAEALTTPEINDWTNGAGGSGTNDL